MSALDRLRSFTGSIAWGPLVNLSRSLILSTLSGIRVGKLTIHERDGTQTICGGLEGPITALHIRKDVFWLRLALFADMVSPFKSLWL